MPDTDAVVDRIITDLGEHFADLDDQEDAVFGEFARVTAEGNVLTVLHSVEPWGVEIIVRRVDVDDDTPYGRLPPRAGHEADR